MVNMDGTWHCGDALTVDYKTEDATVKALLQFILAG